MIVGRSGKGPWPPDSSSGTPAGPKGDRWLFVVAALGGVLLLVLAVFLAFGNPWADPGAEPPAAGSPEPEVSDPAPAPSDQQPEAPPADDPSQPETPVVRYGEEPPANWDLTGVTANDVLNVRTGPGVRNDITGVLPAKTFELESTGRIARLDGQLWREIKVPGGTAGWVNARYLTEHRPPPGLEGVGIGLPASAQLTAREIFTFAQREDLDSLARLALDGDTPFTASFGDDVSTPAELVSLWERIGRDEVLDHLTALVQVPDWYETVGQLPDGQAVSIHVTPRFMHEPTAANRAMLEEQLGDERVQAGIADGQWLGWRLGITAAGDWQFLVSGD